MKNSLKSLSPHSFDYVRNLMFSCHIKLIKNSKIISNILLISSPLNIIRNVVVNFNL